MFPKSLFIQNNNNTKTLMPKKHILGWHILYPFIVAVSCEKEVVLVAVGDAQYW